MQLTFRLNDLNHIKSWRVVAERLRALDSNSVVSDQQCVGSNPGCGTCVLQQDILP